MPFILLVMAISAIILQQIFSARDLSYKMWKSTKTWAADKTDSLRMHDARRLLFSEPEICGELSAIRWATRVAPHNVNYTTSVDPTIIYGQHHFMSWYWPMSASSRYPWSGNQLRYDHIFNLYWESAGYYLNEVGLIQKSPIWWYSGTDLGSVWGFGELAAVNVNSNVVSTGHHAWRSSIFWHGDIADATNTAVRVSTCYDVDAPIKLCTSTAGLVPKYSPVTGQLVCLP